MGMFVNVMRRENWIPYVSPSSLLYASVSAASEGGKTHPRIIHQIEGQTGALHAVSHTVEILERLDGALKHPAASLRVCVSSL